jgi:hypothetical protein
MKQKIISTWYFEQDSEFGGYYPQNSGAAQTAKETQLGLLNFLT